jgi:hypothetical protein
MRRTWVLSLFKHDQPNDAAWIGIEQLAAAWNQNHFPPFEALAPGVLQVSFEEVTKPVMDALVEKLRPGNSGFVARYHLSTRTELEEGDFAAADFIEILGVGLGTEERPFLLNEEALLGSPSTCSQCGWQSDDDWNQVESAVIDESLLDEPAEGETSSGRGGWDFVNLPNGGLLISKWVSGMFEKRRVSGYRLREAIDGATGRPSKRMHQIIAGRRILTPCAEHTRVVGKPHCPECGTAYGDVDGYYWVRRESVAESEIIARHPGSAAELYFSRRVYEMLKAARLNGLHRNDAIFVCRHGDRGEQS